MKKALISAAAAAALLGAAGAAQAEMTINGLFDISYGHNLGDDAAANAGGASKTAGLTTSGNSTSRLEFKGAFDLGEGTKAVVDYTTGGINTAGHVSGADDGNVFSRTAFFGFSNDTYGKLLVGKQVSVVNDVLGGFDYNGASNSTSVGAYTGVSADGVDLFQSGLIKYVSPSFGPFSFEATQQLKELVGGVVDTKKGEVNNDDVYAVGATVAAGGLTVAGAWQSAYNTGGSAGTNFTNIGDLVDPSLGLAGYGYINKAFIGVGAQYDFGVAKVNVQYNSIEDFSTGLMAGVAFNVSGVTFGVQYASASYDKKTFTPDFTLSGVELFANKEVAKNTFLYAEYGTVNNSEDAFVYLDADGKAKAASGFNLGVIYAF